MALDVHLQIFDDSIHLSGVLLERIPLCLKVGVQAENFAIDRQSVLDTLIDDGENALDSRTVVCLLRLVALELLHPLGLIGEVHASFNTLTELDK